MCVDAVKGVKKDADDDDGDNVVSLCDDEESVSRGCTSIGDAIASDDDVENDEEVDDSSDDEENGSA